MRRLGRYALLTRLASGELGDLFLARLDSRLPGGSDVVAVGDPCAFKLVRADIAQDGSFSRTLLSEGAAALRFHHPAAVRLLEVDRIGSELFTVMELIPGAQSLSVVLQRGMVAGRPLGAREILWIGAEIASALHAAHENTTSANPAGMLHLGLSPRSVLVTEQGVVKLLGLGSGKARIQVGFGGTRLLYASPEVLAKKTPDRRADLFSLGVLLHDALSGRRLFRRGSDAETRAAIMDAPIPSVATALAPVHEGVALIVDRLLARDPADRPDTALEVEQVLREAAGDPGGLVASIGRHLAASFRDEIDAQRRVIDAALRRASHPSPRPNREAGMPVITRPAASSLEAALGGDPPRAVPSFPIPQLIGDRTIHKLAEDTPPAAPLLAEQPDTERGRTHDKDTLPPERITGDLLAPPTLAGDVHEDDDGTVTSSPPSTPSGSAGVRRGGAADDGARRSDDDLTPAADVLGALRAREGARGRGVLGDTVRLSLSEAARYSAEATRQEAARHSAEAMRQEAARFAAEAARNETPRDGASAKAAPPSWDQRPHAATVPSGPPSGPPAGRGGGPVSAPPARGSAPPARGSAPPARGSAPPAFGSTPLSGPPGRSNAPASYPPVDGPSPARIARYELLGELAWSGFCSVARAKDPNVGRTVALKIIDPRRGGDPTLAPKARVALLQREARLTGRLRHPNLPVLYDAGRDGPFYFLCYELIEGEPLSGVLAKTPRLEISLTKRILKDIARALDYLHEQGVAHGDIRAANVLIGLDGHARLLDLSMAAIPTEPEHPLRGINSASLTPETIAGHRYAPKSDQFALGVLLYRMIAGEPPFAGNDLESLKLSIAREQPRPPEAVAPAVDGRLSELAMRLLEKDPAVRFKNLGAVIERLDDEAAPAPSSGSRKRLSPAPPEQKDRREAKERLPSTDKLRPSAAVLGTSGAAARTLLIDDGIAPEVLERTLRLGGLDASVVPNPSEALAMLPSLKGVKTVVVSPTAAASASGFRRELRRFAPFAEFRLVPDLGRRVLGSALDHGRLSAALTELLSRAAGLRPRAESTPREDAATMALAVAKRVGADPDEELMMQMALAARDLASRLRVTPTSDEIAAVVPAEIFALFEPIDAVFAEPVMLGAFAPPLVAQIVAVVESYTQMTARREDGTRASPRKAILELRRAADARRVRHDVVEALLDHLRELISALDIPARAAPPKRVLVAAAAKNEPLARRLAEDGYEVEAAGDGEEAWNKLQQQTFDAAIADVDLADPTGAGLLRTIRSDPRMRALPLVILAGSVDDTLDDELQPAFDTDVVARTAPEEAIARSLSRMLAR